MQNIDIGFLAFEPRHDKTNNVAVRPAKTQTILGIRPVWSVFAVRMKKTWVLSYPLSAQRRLWSDWTNAQADLSLRWAHTHFVAFVMSRLIPTTWYKWWKSYIIFDKNAFYAVKRLNKIIFNIFLHSITLFWTAQNEEIMYNHAYPSFTM